jgi:two-component system phosphate regulon response regulator PhoB
MLTARDQEDDMIAALNAGADDYVSKPFSVSTLMARIKAVLRRSAPPDNEALLEVDGIRLDPVTCRVTAAGSPLALSPLEFRLLHFFMAHQERVYSRQQLIEQVWDTAFVEERTVDVHVRRLRKLLEPTGHDRHIQTVRSTGYRFSVRP